MSRPVSGASAQATEASVNKPSPAANVRRRPNRLPTAAPVMSSTANARLYALTVHSSVAIEACRSRCMVLSAVATTSWSSATIRAAADVSASVHFCLLVKDASSSG